MFRPLFPSPQNPGKRRLSGRHLATHHLPVNRPRRAAIKSLSLYGSFEPCPSSLLAMSLSAPWKVGPTLH